MKNRPIARRMPVAGRHRKQVEALAQGQKQVLEMIAAGKPLAEILAVLMRVVETQSPEMLCSVLLLDADGEHLRHGAAPSLPQEYVLAIDGTAIGASVGSCGTAAYRREAVVVEDIATDPLWIDFRDLALRHGLRACWSTPIFDAAGRVLGTFAMYYRRPGRPSAFHLSLVEVATQTAAIAINRHAAEAALRQSVRVLENTFEYMDQGVSILDADLRLAGVNRRFRELLAFPEALCRPGTSIETLFRYNAERGDYGPGDIEAQVRTRMDLTRKFEAHCFERERPDGTVLEIRGLPVPGGGFVTLYTDVTQRVRSERALRESESRKGAILEASLDAILTMDHQGRIVEFNPAAERCFGYTREQAIGAEMAQLIVPPELRERHRAGLRRYLATGEAKVLGRTLELPALRADGTRFDAELAITLIPGSKPPSFTGTLRDVTERAAAAKALRESEARFRALTELSSDLYWETDSAHRITRYVYGAGANAIIPEAQLLGHARWDTPSLAPDEAGWRAHRETLDAHLPFRDFELACLGGDGEAHHYTLSGEPVFESDGRFAGYRGVGREITERKKTEVRLDHLAHYDPLTELPNRALVQDRLSQAIARARRSETLLAVMFLDLDRFKEINDSLGHAAGDEVLKEAARRLQSCLRSTDTVGRLGGDEFTVLLEDVHQVDEISALAGKILEAFAEPAEVAGQELRLSTSIGVTIYPLDGQDAEHLLKNADIAMYQAKQEGRNNFQFFAAEMRTRTERSADLRLRLYHALERGAFALHYQPQVALAGGGIVGVEALLRWSDAELGPVSPARFIPVAEETGLIVPIGDWVLREACRQCKAWLDAGLGPLRVAVNLSPRQFRRKKLAQRIGEILQEAGLPAACLEIEITEGIVMKHAERAVKTLTELNRLGVQIAIDDFGTGFSSLAYLERFPVQVLKIDQSFVQAIRGGRQEAAIVDTVIQLARVLGMKSLAEGVETEAQREYLRARGCDAFQGYLFSRPQAVPAIGELLAAHRREAFVRAG